MLRRGKKETFCLCLWAIILLAVMAAGAALAAGDQAEERSLYDRLGGLMPISVVVSDFIDAMVPDPFLNQNPAINEARQRVPGAYLKYHVTAMVCQATGGGCQYHGRSMKDSHEHLNITDSEWDRMIVIFKAVLDKHSIPTKEQKELLAIIDSTKPDIVTAEAAY